jgi:hypothetical protein
MFKVQELHQKHVGLIIHAEKISSSLYQHELGVRKQLKKFLNSKTILFCLVDWSKQ